MLPNRPNLLAVRKLKESGLRPTRQRVALARLLLQNGHRHVTAEELVRFAHDPRIRQIAMLDDDRFEILDLTVRPDSELADRPFRELPATGSMIAWRWP